MYNLARSVHQLLEDNSVAKIEVCAVPPFIKLIFDKSELQALIRGKAEISNVIAKYFLRRRVFWIDIRKEHYEGVKKSLAEVESGLDDQAIALASNTDASVVALAKCVRAWTTATSLVHKQLVDSLRDIDEEKALTLDSLNEHHLYS